MWQASASLNVLRQQYLPELALATAFEREILNARIHFIYHVTIQKPGALAAGWQRFRNVRELMPKLSRQVELSASLEPLRRPTKQLADDLDRYEDVLQRILAAVAKGQNTGPGFAGLIAEWAGAGGRVVNGAGELQRLCSEATSGSSLVGARKLDSAVVETASGCLLVAVLGSILGWVLSRGIGSVLAQVARELTGAASRLTEASGRVSSAGWRRR